MKSGSHRYMLHIFVQYGTNFAPEIFDPRSLPLVSSHLNNIFTSCFLHIVLY